MIGIQCFESEGLVANHVMIEMPPFIAISLTYQNHGQSRIAYLHRHEGQNVLIEDFASRL